MLGEVELILLRRDSSAFPSHPSPLTKWHLVPITSMSCAVSSEGTGRREKPPVNGAAGLAAACTCEREGLTHTGNCFLNGLEVTRFQVMADMLWPGWAIT